MGKISKMKIYFVMLLSLFLMGVVSCQQKESNGITSPETLKKETTEFWTCSMHPQIKLPSPGNCPICGMTLIKVDSNVDSKLDDNRGSGTGGSEHASFFLTPYRKQLIGVTTAKVVKKKIVKKISAPGKLAFDPELYTAISEYREALRQFNELKNSPLPEVKRSNEQLLHSAQTRLKLLGMTPEQQAGLQHGDSLILPTNRQNLLVYADVFEMDLPYIHKGQLASLSGQALAGKNVWGEVTSVDPVINATTRTLRVRIAVKELPAMLPPESYLDVIIHSPQGDYLTVPFASILTTGQRSLLFKVEGDRYIPKEVEVAFTAGDEVALLEETGVEGGIKDGDEIVTSGNFLIDSESRLQSLRSSGDEHAHQNH